MVDQIALTSKCFEVLCENVGTVEMEWFLHFIKSGKIDYTQWRREH